MDTEQVYPRIGVGDGVNLHRAESLTLHDQHQGGNLAAKPWSRSPIKVRNHGTNAGECLYDCDDQKLPQSVRERAVDSAGLRTTTSRDVEISLVTLVESTSLLTKPLAHLALLICVYIYLCSSWWVSPR